VLPARVRTEPAPREAPEPDPLGPTAPVRASLAFLVMSHRPPRQLLRLMSALRREQPDAPLVVHHDVFRSVVDRPAVEAVGNAHLLTSAAPVHSSDFSLVEATWRSLSWMSDHLEFDWVVLLSAQDYPIKPLSGLGAHLARSGADALMDAVPIGAIAEPLARADRHLRYMYQYRPARAARRSRFMPFAGPARTQRIGPVGNLAIDAFNQLQPRLRIYKLDHARPLHFGARARSTPFTAAEPCWYAPTWWALSRRAARYVLDEARSRPDYVGYYRRTMMPDESATATLVCNSPDLRVQLEGLHHTRWADPSAAHPDVFRIADLAELGAAREPFARKFDIDVDTAILDELDAGLAGPEGRR
jgi:hypothetical protein